MGRRRSLPVGIRIKRQKYQALVRVATRLRGKSFPRTPEGLTKAVAWRDQQIATTTPRETAAGSFVAEIEEYLAKPEVKALPSVTKKNGKPGSYARMLAWWVHWLGADRTSATIERDEIEAGIQHLLASGMASATVYHYRTPLLRMWTVLHGKHAPNPARGTTRPEHYRETEKSIPYDTVVAILDAMPTERAIKKGIRIPSLARLVAVTVAATGIPVAELNKLHRRLFQPTFGYIEMPWRNKGAGVEAHRRQLLKPGIEALAALFARFPHGRIAVSSPGCTRSFKRAARAVAGPDTPISLYWLRHTFGTDVYRLTADIEVVRRLLGHAEGSVCTARYTKGAHVAVDRAALQKLAADRRQATSDKLPAEVARDSESLDNKDVKVG